MIMADFDTIYERIARDGTRRHRKRHEKPAMPIRKVWRDQPKPRGKP
jgi:hypothetical protein